MKGLSKYMKHESLGFVVETTGEYRELKLDDDWIKVDDESVFLFEGKVIYDPLESWNPGKESRNWAAESFVATPPYVVDFYGPNNKFWEVTDLRSGDTYEGEIYDMRTSDDERAELVEIEWESDLPEDSDEIETAIYNSF